MRRIAIKRLTASDLTLFEWHLRNSSVGKQKSINLNADVFIDVLYKELPDLAEEMGGAIPLDLSIFGPGFHGLHNLQRKIIKRGSYKNWRLDGEHIPEQVGRYAVLGFADLAVMEFFGVPIPKAATLVLLSANVRHDLELHRVLSEEMGSESMRAIAPARLELLIARAQPPTGHPIGEFLLEGPLEDAAERGIGGIRQLGIRRGRSVGREELRRARKRSDQIGRLGEELLDSHLRRKREAGQLLSYEWISDEEALSPYDFTATETDGTRFRLDAKSTAGQFERVLHISLAELQAMSSSESRYDLYRLYEVTPEGAKLRVHEDMRPFAEEVLAKLNPPPGVTVDSVSVDPTLLDFGSTEEISEP